MISVEMAAQFSCDWIAVWFCLETREILFFVSNVVIYGRWTFVEEETLRHYRTIAVFLTDVCWLSLNLFFVLFFFCASLFIITLRST
jgi:hypothetical protein